jgi:uncharacterized protein
MTPQEKDLVDELFDRLAKLEAMPRDPDAERTIAGGVKQAPHALYALVQTALVQDEALKRANARIEELQAEAADAPEQRPTSFLDSVRGAFGGAPPRGSVPSVRTQTGPAQDNPPQNYQPQGGYPPPPPGYGGGPAFGTGGSFLGTAASSAAGVLGGALLLDGIRSMFGHHSGASGGSALGDFRSDQASPWTSSAGSAADSQLARDAGIDHIGDHAGDGEHVSDAGSTDTDAGEPFDGAEDDEVVDDNDFGDGDGGSGDDSYDV